MTGARPSDDPRFHEALGLFNAGHYFEAHEVWEALWHHLDKRAPDAERPGGDRRFVQGLIQLAVSLEHWRRGNPRGARGQWDKAREKLACCGDARDGIDLAAVLGAAGAFYAERDLPTAEAAQRAGIWAKPGREPYPRIQRLP